MDYIIKNKNSELYLPKVEFWILDDLKLSLRQAMLYKIILQKGFLIWNIEYIAKILRCDPKTIWRDLNTLTDFSVVDKESSVFGSRTRACYVARYDERGLRNGELRENLMQQGMDKLRLLYKKG